MPFVITSQRFDLSSIILELLILFQRVEKAYMAGFLLKDQTDHILKNIEFTAIFHYLYTLDN
jgi:hypothetical protein